jgi:hypothetical protein
MSVLLCPYVALFCPAWNPVIFYIYQGVKKKSRAVMSDVLCGAKALCISRGGGGNGLDL